MSEQSNEAGASETIQQLLLTTFSDDQRPATKEDVARLYSVIVHLRDIVVTQAGLIATMPLTPEQASHFSESEMPLKGLQQAIGDGLVELLGDKREEIDG